MPKPVPIDQLIAKIKKVKPKKFKPCAVYSKKDKLLEVFLDAGDSLSKFVNKHVSLRIDPQDSSKILGYTISDIELNVY